MELQPLAIHCILFFLWKFYTLKYVVFKFHSFSIIFYVLFNVKFHCMESIEMMELCNSIIWNFNFHYMYNDGKICIPLNFHYFTIIST